jgi:hypothetical protein
VLHWAYEGYLDVQYNVMRAGEERTTGRACRPAHRGLPRPPAGELLESCWRRVSYLSWFLPCSTVLRYSTCCTAPSTQLAYAIRIVAVPWATGLVVGRGFLPSYSQPSVTTPPCPLEPKLLCCWEERRRCSAQAPFSCNHRPPGVQQACSSQCSCTYFYPTYLVQ